MILLVRLPLSEYDVEHDWQDRRSVKKGHHGLPLCNISDNVSQLRAQVAERLSMHVFFSRSFPGFAVMLLIGS